MERVNKFIDTVLHFLKEFPPWVVLSVLAVFLLLRFQPSDPRFYERITDAVLVSLFTALGVRSRTPAADVNADIKTDNLTMTLPPPAGTQTTTTTTDEGTVQKTETIPPAPPDEEKDV